MNVSVRKAPSVELHNAESRFYIDMKQGGRRWALTHLVLYTCTLIAKVSKDVGVNLLNMSYCNKM